MKAGKKTSKKAPEEQTRRPKSAFYDTPITGIDFRKHPERYRVGRGEQGVLMAEPYKSELLPHWRFKTPAEARRSARELLARFTAYRDAGDFVGMDMARKFIQMGHTRARRYANYPGGRKYDATGAVRPRTIDPVKAESAAVFKTVWARVEADKTYAAAKRAWRAARG